MILIYIALVLSVFQFSLAPNALLHSISAKLALNSVVPAQTKLAFDKSTYTPEPELKAGAKPFVASAKEALIYDVASGKILYQKDDAEPVAMASLTKLMTALVILQNHKPDEVVTIPDNLPDLGPADQKIGVKPGEKFKLSELMQGLLIYSANDVANSLAIWDSGSTEKFANKMNSYGAQWGLQDSHFVNPSGLDEAGHQSSAKDLATLATVLLHNNPFRQIVSTQKATIHNEAGKAYALTTTNHDLGLPNIYGIKTGFTDNAGQSLILLARKSGHEIITVVLNSPDRFQESRNMVDYTFNNYVWK